MYRVLISGLFLAGLSPSVANATTLICSDPDRARILDRATVALPTDKIEMLERRFGWTAERIGMTTWGVASGENDLPRRKTLGMQSPKVSVSIQAEWSSGQKFANLAIERTCYTDDLEPWRPYWRAFLRELRTAGYRVTKQ
ncbi:MAG: hypothetical protein AAGK01_00230 [Pseudomonadota bacterium]